VQRSVTKLSLITVRNAAAVKHKATAEHFERTIETLYRANSE
jgi:hypothetical protein